MIDIIINIYLPLFFDWLLETSFMASILVGLILCFKVFLRNKLTPRWHYILWMILIVRLLLPWSPESRYSIYSFLSFGLKMTHSVETQTPTSLEKESLHEIKGIPIQKVLREEEHYAKNTLPISNGNNKVTTSLAKQNDKPISLYTMALYVWLTGVIVLSFTTFLVNRRLNTYIKTQPVITDRRILDIFNRCKKSMSVQKRIPLQFAGEISNPTVLGFFRPRVLLSRDLVNRLTDEQLRHIFYHELAHVKRRDVGVNWIMHSLLILNWFNPILWFAYVRMREDQELACDAFALTFMEEEEKISYGHTLINLLEHYTNYQVPSLENLSRNKSTLKRRISMIKNFNKKSYRLSALGVIIVIAVSSLSLLNVKADETNDKHSVKAITEKEPTIGAKIGESEAKKENPKPVDKKTINQKEWKDLSSIGNLPKPDFPTNAKDWIVFQIKEFSKKSDSKMTPIGYDKGYDYYLKSKLRGLGSYIRVEGVDLKKDFENLFELSGIIAHEQFVRTASIDPNGDAMEKTEYANQWKPTSKRMQISFEYMKELLNDIDVAINKDGKGHTFGVSHQLGGNKVNEMESFMRYYDGE
ncbi:M48 family metalloprotease [Bacillus sp. BRMEA1]|uniref:M56 family metallopeptidase n=1 Tax=Neobacillus endophyticus TaxID=2738405 RepID=UPI0015666BF0|nr:M56 family metallopeptidase [Neobacillus endophyticus]NRD78525.1 M48 family metalloprotease [Neobacillus endophyticus]